MDIKWKKVSYIGRPCDDSVMYVTSKIGDQLAALRQVKNCLIFAEDGMTIADDLRKVHTFEFVSNPASAYSKYVKQLASLLAVEAYQKKWQITEAGVTIGEGVSIGEDVLIEPGVVIGHGVTLGDRVTIRANSTVFNAKIGNDVTIDCGAAIGVAGFTATMGDNDELVMIPTLGSVEVEDNVYIGAKTTVAAGTAGATTIKRGTKIAAQVTLEHDVTVMPNVEICAGVVIGGFVTIGEGAFVGLNASIRNRRGVGSGVVLGMGSVLLTNLEANTKAYGVPAKRYQSKK